MGQPNAVHDPTIDNVLQALQTARADANAVQREINDLRAGLQWAGDAATEFRASLDRCSDDVTVVLNNVGHIQNGMEQHRSISTRTETTNTGDAKWHRG